MLTFSDVTVRFPNAPRPALDAFSLSIDEGENVALIGPSGAGKSTILSLAAGLSLPDEGSVSVLGIDSARLGARSNRQIRSRLGIVRQDFALVGSLRVANNVAAGRLGTWSIATALRSLVRPRDLDEIRAVLAEVGIADKLWDRADQLSGGQQQRTAIARALFQAPDLLLADEPVSALDPARSGAVLETLTRQQHPADKTGATDESNRPKRTVLASLHDAPLACQYFDRVVALRDGRLVFDLEPARITADMLSELYKLEDSGRS